MITREEANKELRTQCARIRPLNLIIKGKETFIRAEPSIPDYVPPGEYEITAAQLIEKGDPVIIYQTRVKIEAETEEEIQQERFDPVAQMYAQQVAAMQELSTLKASAKDEFYRSMLQMTQDNYKQLNLERKQMRDEFLAERELHINLLKDKIFKQLQPNTTVLPPEKESAMDRVLEQVLPGAIEALQPVIMQLILKTITPTEKTVNPGAPHNGTENEASFKSNGHGLSENT